jgi:hypothetical protein
VGQSPPDPVEPGALGNIAKRALQFGPYWELSQVSAPRGADWYGDSTIRDVDLTGKLGTDYGYYYHESAGEGQYIYVVEEGFDDTHSEFNGVNIEYGRGTGDYGEEGFPSNNPKLLLHGTGVTSKVVGQELGVAKKATAVIIPLKMTRSSASFDEPPPPEKVLEALLNAADDIATKGRAGRAVVNLSFTMDTLQEHRSLIVMLRKSLSSPELVFYPAKLL